MPDHELVPAIADEVPGSERLTEYDDWYVETYARLLEAANEGLPKGCVTVSEETASGGELARPVLAALLDRLDAGDTFVVVRLDRLGRSLLHLLETISGLNERGVHFRSLGDPVDTASPQGRFKLLILGAMAEFTRNFAWFRSVRLHA